MLPLNFKKGHSDEDDILNEKLTVYPTLPKKQKRKLNFLNFIFCVFFILH
jgi:hypothetical protein